MNKIHSICSVILFCLTFQGAQAQQRIVLNNNAFLVIEGNGSIVIENSNPNALTILGSGGNIISEHELDVIKWKIGTNTGNYTIPFTTQLGTKIPLAFSIQGAGSGNGYYLFSTYGTSNLNLPLPSSVLAVNNALSKNDRYWFLKPSGFTTSPSGMLAITYSTVENGGTNLITASDLLAEGYSSTTNTWGCLNGINNSSMNKVESIPISSGNTNFVWALGSKLKLNMNSTNVSCFNGTNGTAQVTASGGAGSYSYLWSPIVANSASVSGLVAGNYTVSVTDAQGCNATSNVTITQPSALSITSTQSNVACNGNSTGSIDLSVNGGIAPYLYSWSNSSTTQDVSSLSAGIHSVNVTDANGCTVQSDITITEPAILTLNTTQVDIACFGNSTGSIDLNVTGGVAPYTYAWSNGLTSQDVTSLAAGAYSVTVTDANGCNDNISVTLTQPTALNVTSTQNNVGCYGGSTGSIDLNVSGGTAPYLYLWSNGAFTQDLVQLASANYSVNVTDNNGCTSSLNSQISQPNAPLLLNTNQLNNVCLGGASGLVDLTVSGGTAPYSYLWSNGSPTQDLSSLVAGTYSVTVTDFNGCNASSTVIITQPSTGMTLSETHEDVECHGNYTGSIDLTVNGGSGPYTYAWSNTATTQDIIGLSAGPYSVSVLDAQGCSSTLSMVISQPLSALSLNSINENVSCYGGFNGSIDLNVNGGTAPYSYNWSNGALTQDINSVAAGSYSVIVSDNNGCISNFEVTLIQPSSALVLNESHVNALCYGSATGTINLTVTGGTLPYSYQWSNGYNNEDLNSLTAGAYTVVVNDANGCNSSLLINITQNSQIITTINLQVGAGETIAIGNNIYNSAGVYQNDFTAINGCDSAVVVNITWKDSDGDGVNDGLEDYDGDGVNNAEEITGVDNPSTPYITTSQSNFQDPCDPQHSSDYMGYDVNNPIWAAGDCDGDGISNGTEYNFGSSPYSEDKMVIVPDGFSPNEDGLNDLLEIQGIKNFPNNKLSIFNRWGQLVFEAAPYENNWDGKNWVGNSFISNELTEGTFFYVFTYDETGSKVSSGYIFLTK